jgi:hypothetical protein
MLTHSGDLNGHIGRRVAAIRLCDAFRPLRLLLTDLSNRLAGGSWAEANEGHGANAYEFLSTALRADYA